jgi:hypothetical protein
LIKQKRNKINRNIRDIFVFGNKSVTGFTVTDGIQIAIFSSIVKILNHISVSLARDRFSLN